MTTFLPGTIPADSPVPLERRPPVASTVDVDGITAAAIAPFDFAWNGTTAFTPWQLPDLPPDYQLGVIVGGSGSGKSTLLHDLDGPTPDPGWDDGRTIAAHFPTADDAATRLAAVGLASVPAWTKPYRVLSTGERFRADLARNLTDGARIDEFSSVVDRHVAQAASVGFARHIRRHGLRGIVVATCHRDVLPWLQPDWFIDTDSGEVVHKPRECLQPEPLVVEVHRASRDAWQLFAGHHYLIDTLHDYARCYVATWGDVLVGFASAIPFPHGALKDAWRETRTVVLPEFQGLGIGTKLSDTVAALHRGMGCRYFSRTQHPRMGEYRQRHPELWRPTSSNLKQEADRVREGRFDHWQFDHRRVAYSHEYVGPGSAVADPIAEQHRAKREAPKLENSPLDFGDWNS